MEQKTSEPHGIVIPESKGGRVYKVLILAALALCAWVLVWMLTNRILVFDLGWENWLLPSLVSVMAITFSALFAMVVYRQSWFLVLNGLIFLAYLVLFPKNEYVYLGGVMFFLLNFMFFNRIKSEEKSRADFSFRRTLDPGLTIIIWAVLILLGFNIYYQTAKSFERNPQEFYDRLSQSVSRNVSRSTAIATGEYDLNQTIDEYLIRQAEKQSAEFSKIPEQQQREFLAEARKQFYQQYGLQESSGNVTLVSIVSQYMTQSIQDSARKYEKYFPLIFTLIILALLRTFAFIYRWAILFISWFIFRILLGSRFFKLHKVPVMVEKLDLS